MSPLTLLKVGVMLGSYFGSVKDTQLDKAVRSGQDIRIMYFDSFIRNGIEYPQRFLVEFIQKRGNHRAPRKSKVF